MVIKVFEKSSKNREHMQKKEYESYFEVSAIQASLTVTNMSKA